MSLGVLFPLPPRKSTEAGWRFASINVNVTYANRLDTQPETTVTRES